MGGEGAEVVGVDVVAWRGEGGLVRRNGEEVIGGGGVIDCFCGAEER